MPEESAPRASASASSSRWSSSASSPRRSASRSGWRSTGSRRPPRRRPSTIDTLWDVLMIASVPIFVLVTVVVLFSVVEFRMRPGEETSTARRSTATPASRSSGPRSRRSSSSASCAYAYIVLRDIEKAPADAATSAWSTSPASSSPGPSSTTRAARRSHARSSTCPRRVGEVRRQVQGRHPRLLGPGVPHEDRRRARASRPTTASRRTARSATYPIVCAELCGLGHAFMRQTAHVLARADFDKPGSQKMTAQAAPPAAAAAAAAARPCDAKELFTKATPTRAPRPAAPATRWPTRAPTGQVGPEPRQGAQGQGRGLHQASRSSTPTRRSRRASRPASCRRTSAIRCRPSSSTPWSSTCRR